MGSKEKSAKGSEKAAEAKVEAGKENAAAAQSPGAEENKKESRMSETIKIQGVLERAVDEVDRTLAANKDIVLDFSACPFITVEGLEWLEELMLRAQSKEASVRFEKLHPPVYKVFKVAHIDSLLQACGAPSSPQYPFC